MIAEEMDEGIARGDRGGLASVLSYASAAGTSPEDLSVMKILETSSPRSASFFSYWLTRYLDQQCGFRQASAISRNPFAVLQF